MSRKTYELSVGRESYFERAFAAFCWELPFGCPRCGGTRPRSLECGGSGGYHGSVRNMLGPIAGFAAKVVKGDIIAPGPLGPNMAILD